MEQYELTLLFSVKEDNYKKGSDSAREILQKMNGKISKEEDMGERPLAYLIRKEEYGHYLFWNIELHSGEVESLKNALQKELPVLRFLLLKK